MRPCRHRSPAGLRRGRVRLHRVSLARRGEKAGRRAGSTSRGGRASLRAGQRAGKGRPRRSPAAAGAGSRDLGRRQERPPPLGDRVARGATGNRREPHWPFPKAKSRGKSRCSAPTWSRSRSSSGPAPRAIKIDSAWRSWKPSCAPRASVLAVTRSRPPRPTCGPWKRPWPRRNGTSPQKRQTAPQAGLVFDTLFREGEWVAAGRPVVALLPPRNIKVRAFVPEQRIGAICRGATRARSRSMACRSRSRER